MSERSSGGSSGAVVLGLLGVALIVLKLCGVIAWSWWWVTAPLWGPLAVVALLVAIYFLLVLLDGRRDRKAAKR